MTLQNSNHKKGTLILSAFIILKFVIQYLVVNPIYELQRDEYLHLDQANHLAWGFHSVPPVTSWISWLILQLGNTHFWVKFFPTLFGAFTMVIVWKTVEALKGNLYACILTATAFLFSSFLRINMLYQPNSLDILCWTLLFYNFIKFIQTQHYKWLYLMAITFAIGFLNKYNITFCLLGLMPALLLSKYRTLFLKPHFYLALLLGALLILPNLIWQFQNDFPVFKHLKELNDTQLVHVNRIDFVKDQILFFLGALFILIAGFISLFTYAPFKPYRLLFWSYVFTIIIFIYLRAKGYYALGLYPIFLAFGAVYLSNLMQHGWKFYLRYVAIGIILLMFIPVLKVALPLRTPEKYAEDAKLNKPFSQHRWEDGKIYPISQDFADMLGWKELARKVDSIYKTLPDKKHTLIFCDNYGQAGSINYYTKVDGLVASSFNADYIDWIDLNTPTYTVIRVKELKHKNNTQDEALFEDVKHVQVIESTYAREKGTQISVLSNPKMDVNQLLMQELKKQKK
jgi:hypothetical protein